MSRVVSIGVGLCAIALSITSCGASNNSTPLSVEPIALPSMPEETLKAGESFFIPGETLGFDISLRGVIGGTVQLAVGDPGVVDGRSVVIVKSLVQSAGFVAAIKEVRDEIVTMIDVETGAVLKHDLDSKFGDLEAAISTDMGKGAPGTFALTYTRKGQAPKHVIQNMPPDAIAFDVHAILGVVRGWNPQDGDEESFFMISGRRLWRSSLRVGAHETIRTAMGKNPTIRIDGVAQRVTSGLRDLKSKQPRNYSLWLSDDANRLPLLVMATTEYGDLRLELVEYDRPDRRFSTRE